jgi:hypothetical protein
MASTSRLSLYNGALRLLGERALASLSEAREPRRFLDSSWDDNVVLRALEAGQWRFATRSQQFDFDPDVEAGFEGGYQYAFTKPDDFVRTMGVCQDAYFNVPLTQYSDEASHWWADLQTIYVQYVSSHEAFGLDMSKWPQSFVKYLEALLASEIVMPLKQNRQAWLDAVEMANEMLKQAMSQNAMAQPAKFLPTSSWAAARGRGTTRTGER